MTRYLVFHEHAFFGSTMWIKCRLLSKAVSNGIVFLEGSWSCKVSFNAGGVSSAGI